MSVILARREIEIRKMAVQDQPLPAWAKSLPEPYLNQWLGAVVHTYHPSSAGKHKEEDCGPGR
jgi:hypothetical protein